MMTQMIAGGQTGNKQGKGFYRDGEAGREVLDFETLQYRPAPRPNLPLAERAEQQGVGLLLDDDSRYGQFAWRVLSRSLGYAAALIPEVGDDPVAIDDAMKLGYNWIQGPFEMLDEIGVDRFIERLQNEQRPVPEFLAEARGSSFYRVADGELQARRHGGGWQAIRRPDGVIRFSEKRQTLTPRNTCAYRDALVVRHDDGAGPRPQRQRGYL